MSNQAPSRRYTQYLMPLIIASALIYQTYFVPFDSSRPISLADAHKLPAQYKNFLVIGASYNDNAHSRKLEHAASLRDYYPFNLFGGRYSNGPVAVEYLAQSGAQHINYAYGHSTIDNDLTPSPFPASKDQIQQYLMDLSTKTVELKPGKSLYYFNTGINPTTGVWRNMIKDSTSLAEAQSIISRNVKTLAHQIQSLEKESPERDFDLFISGIPPLDTVPFHIQFAEEDSTKLETLKILAAQFNEELKEFALRLQQELKGTRRVFYFDMQSFWKSMYSNPGMYGLAEDRLLDSCWVEGATEMCTDPENYIYFDSSHPTSVTNKRMAVKMAEVLRSVQKQ